MPTPYPTDHKAAEARRKADQAHFEPKGEPKNLDRTTISEPAQAHLEPFSPMTATRVNQTRTESVEPAHTSKAALKAPNRGE